MKHFNNPVSMRVPSQEAFERDLKKPLEELGAKFECIVDFKKYPILVSNSSGENGIIENLLDSDKLNFNRHFIETYDPEQFIAICKLEVEMIVGECYTVVDCDGQKMTGYLLKNNSQNIGFNLSGQFKGIGYLGYYFENANVTYSSEMHTIRLSTPEEKAILDKVISEHTEVKGEIIVTDSELKPKPIKFHDRLNLFKESIKQHLDSYDETKLKIEKQIKEHEEEIEKLYSALKVLEALK